jgi:hypothetical protein
MKKVIKGFWLDDHINEVEFLCNKLSPDSIEIDLYDNDSELTDVLRKRENNYSVGIIDLKFDNLEDDGIAISHRLQGLLSEGENPINLPLGTVTYHIQQFSKKLEDENNNPFVFKYDKTALVNGQFYNFKRSIIEYSDIYENNTKAIQYNTKNPVKGFDPDQYKYTNVFFGYVEQIDEENMYIRFWNPKELKSGFTRRYSIDALKEYGIGTENQHVRLTFFENIIAGKKISVPFIEPIGNIDTSVRFKLDNNFDYSKFK